jgi:hypothetical protein
MHARAKTVANERQNMHEASLILSRLSRGQGSGSNSALFILMCSRQKSSRLAQFHPKAAAVACTTWRYSHSRIVIESCDRVPS